MRFMESRCKGQQGAGMIEVLVAVLVVAIGVIGYAGMQLTALRSSDDAARRTLATLIASDALERMLINPNATLTYLDTDNWPAGAQAPGSAFPTACLGTQCDPAALAQADIDQLSWAAAQLLPVGRVAASNDCTGVPSASCVVVSWDGVAPAECLAGGAVDAEPSCLVLEGIRI